MVAALSTIDEILDALPESTRVEVHDGKVVVNPPPTGRHQLVVDSVQDWLKARRATRVLTGIGIVFDVAQRFVPDIVVVAPGAEIDPDATWQQPDRFELVVEVLSPSSRRDDPGIKRDHYHGAGLAYWLVDPEARTVESFDDSTGLDPNELAAVLWADQAGHT